MHGYYWHGGGMWMFSIVLLPIIFIIVWAMMKYNGFDNAKETPLEILKRRYAHGEISTEEFNERKKHLEEKE